MSATAAVIAFFARPPRKMLASSDGGPISTQPTPSALLSGP
jgi:hypothetical protein